MAREKKATKKEKIVERSPEDIELQNRMHKEAHAMSVDIGSAIDWKINTLTQFETREKKSIVTFALASVLAALMVDLADKHHERLLEMFFKHVKDYIQIGREVLKGEDNGHS
jgi:hypothetical protein